MFNGKGDTTKLFRSTTRTTTQTETTKLWKHRTKKKGHNMVKSTILKLPTFSKVVLLIMNIFSSVKEMFSFSGGTYVDLQYCLLLERSTFH